MFFYLKVSENSKLLIRNSNNIYIEFNEEVTAFRSNGFATSDDHMTHGLTAIWRSFTPRAQHLTGFNKNSILLNGRLKTKIIITINNY